jgi:hypothetical protein
MTPGAVVRSEAYAPKKVDLCAIGSPLASGKSQVERT